MEKEKIRYIALVLGILIFFVVAYQFVKVKDLDLDLVRSSIKDLKLENSQLADGKDLRNNYGLDEKDLEDYVYYKPRTNMDAEEILVIKSPRAKDFKALVDQRIKKQEESFKNYAPDKYELLEARYYELEGDYLILLVSEKKDDLLKMIRGDGHGTK